MRFSKTQKEHWLGHHPTQYRHILHYQFRWLENLKEEVEIAAPSASQLLSLFGTRTVKIDLHAIVSTSEYFHLRLLNALSSLQLLMGTLKDLRMKILSRMYLKLLEQMCSQPTSLAQLTLLPLLELSFHFLPSLWRILKNTSHLRSKFWMTRMSADDSEHQTFKSVRAMVP